jgi:hypothetical protein
MGEEHDHPQSDGTGANGRPGLETGLERALARLAIVDEHLRKVDEHVSRARAAERTAAAR